LADCPKRSWPLAGAVSYRRMMSSAFFLVGDELEIDVAAGGAAGGAAPFNESLLMSGMLVKGSAALVAKGKLLLAAAGWLLGGKVSQEAKSPQSPADGFLAWLGTAENGSAPYEPAGMADSGASSKSSKLFVATAVGGIEREALTG
jgi:hypothetical protein